MTNTLVATCLAVLLASVLGGTVPLAMVLNHTRLQVYLSFSAGAMLGEAFFHMMPEAVRIGSAATIPWAGAAFSRCSFSNDFFHSTITSRKTRQVRTAAAIMRSNATTRASVHHRKALRACERL